MQYSVSVQYWWTKHVCMTLYILFVIICKIFVKYLSILYCVLLTCCSGKSSIIVVEITLASMESR